MQSIEKLRKASNEKKQMSHDVSIFFLSNIFPSFLVHVIVNMAMNGHDVLSHTVSSPSLPIKSPGTSERRCWRQYHAGICLFPFIWRPSADFGWTWSVDTKKKWWSKGRQESFSGLFEKWFARTQMGSYWWGEVVFFGWKMGLHDYLRKFMGRFGIVSDDLWCLGQFLGISSRKLGLDLIGIHLILLVVISQFLSGRPSIWRTGPSGKPR